MNESMKKLRDEWADAIFMRNRGFKLDELTRQDSQYSMELSLIKSGFNACFDIMISRMVYDSSKVHHEANKSSNDSYYNGFEDGSEFQFNQDLANLKGD